jgi:hypothetical protein
MGELLDTLIAIRMGVGHSANGIAASPTLGPEQMREIRVLLDCAWTPVSAFQITASRGCGSGSLGVPLSSLGMVHHDRRRSLATLI